MEFLVCFLGSSLLSGGSGSLDVDCDPLTCLDSLTGILLTAVEGLSKDASLTLDFLRGERLSLTVSLLLNLLLLLLGELTLQGESRVLVFLTGVACLSTDASFPLDFFKGVTVCSKMKVSKMIAYKSKNIQVTKIFHISLVS